MDSATERVGDTHGQSFQIPEKFHPSQSSLVFPVHNLDPRERSTHSQLSGM